jgi:hypothetical protein
VKDLLLSAGLMARRSWILDGVEISFYFAFRIAV